MTAAAWDEAAEAAVRSVADELGDGFTTDDVWDRLAAEGVTLPDGVGPRRLGNVMTRLSGRGVIEATAERVPSRRRERHNGDVRVWTAAGMRWARVDAIPARGRDRALLQAAADQGGVDLIDLVTKVLEAGRHTLGLDKGDT